METNPGLKMSKVITVRKTFMREFKSKEWIFYKRSCWNGTYIWYGENSQKKKKKILFARDCKISYNQKPSYR